MNLIEQLGGYEKAKQILISCEFHGRKDLRVPVAGGFIHIVVDFLEKDLLDYRRQHNIFEAGDLVVMADADDYDTIFKVIGKPKRLYHLQGNDDLFYGRLDFQIRHATDAEIEAGKRLEVG
jgi:hypothetical protein